MHQDIASKIVPKRLPNINHLNQRGRRKNVSGHKDYPAYVDIGNLFGKHITLQSW